ncbi:hypothetical protein LJC73_04730, partial [Bacteroidales bacterium OttesenSCG-928-L14]|nr:hypothetical protein [Bacteroidales bacterium OttesenSCG-928-L14]
VNSGITSLNVNGANAMNTLRCGNNPLRELDISGNSSKLRNLYCENCNLKEIDFSNYNFFKRLSCGNNSIPLVELKKYNELIVYENMANLTALGIQSMPIKLCTSSDPIVLDSVFYGVGTKFTFEGTPATPGVDYIIGGGAVSFFKPGYYIISITNPAIQSDGAYRVVETIEVPDLQNIHFTWKGSTSGKTVALCTAASGTNNVRVNWGDGNTNTYSCNGIDDLVLNHTYSNTNNYNVTISTLHIGSKITRFDISNQQVSALDVTKAVSLKRLNCSNNQLTSLELSDYYSNTRLDKLEVLNVSNNNLSTIEIGRCYVLKEFYCNNNQITGELVLTPNSELEKVNISNNQISRIGLNYRNINLKELYCRNNSITEIIYLYDAKYLEILDCSYCLITNLDLSNSSKLKTLSCESNKLSFLDITPSVELIELNCGNNNLRELNLTNNTKLLNWDCSNNRIASLTIDNMPNIVSSNCVNNAIPIANVKQIYEQTNAKCDVGTQILDTIVWNKSSVVVDDAYYGVGTNFVVKLDGNAAVQGTDYSITGGTISFMKSGLYSIEMTNPTNLPLSNAVKVIANYNVSLPDELSFVWAGNGNSTKSFSIGATPGTNNVEVKWGDNYDTQTYSVAWYGSVSLTSPAYGNTTNHVVNLSTPDLTSLYLNNAQVSSIDVSKVKNLSKLQCYNNAIPLVELKNIVDNTSDMPQSDRSLGTQTLSTQTWTRTMAVIDSVFGGTSGGTQFVVKLNNKAAVVGTDYKISGGSIVFMKSGLYNITITNPTKLVSNTTYPAKVITEYDVTLPQPIIFTWAGNGSSTKSFTMRAASGTDNIIVNWGNGYATQTFSGKGAGTDATITAPAYGNTTNHTVSIIADDITLLNLANVKVSEIDLSNATELTTLYCNNNMIPLIGLKDIADKTTSIEQSNKRLGTQTLETQVWTNITALVDSVFNGVGTSFVVKLNGSAATEGIDYSINGGSVIFLKSGLFNIEITNPTKLVSNTTYPAKVITEYDVTLPQPITFTWAGNGSSTKTFTLRANSGTDNVLVNWGEGYNAQVFSGTGTDLTLTSPIYGNTTNHTVSVFSYDITLLNIAGNQVSELNVSNATSLTTLDCSSNLLSSLDLSGNTALTSVYCNDNIIPLLGLKNIADKTTSISTNNKRLGTQRLDTITWTSPTAEIDPVFNGTGTSFAVKLDGNSATSGTDYKISGGNITFLKSDCTILKLQTQQNFYQTQVILQRLSQIMM